MEKECISQAVFKIGKPIYVTAKTEDEFDAAIKKETQALTSDTYGVSKYMLGVIIPIDRQKAV